ncbi:MAG: recombinase family protein [Bdellovibrionales bacterium]
MNDIYYRNKNAVAILRVSSGRQKDGISHQVQEQKIREYCEENEFNLVKSFVLTESAKDSDGRKKYHEAMNFIRKNKYGNVLFYAPDREARNLIDLAENEIRVLSGELTIHYVSDRKVMHKNSPDSDFLTRDFNGVIARHYSRNLSTRVCDAMRAKAATGWFPNSRPPLGYVCQKAVDSETGRTKNRGGIIILDPNINNRQIVLREFELRTKGLSYEKIRETVLAEGLMSKKQALKYRKNTIENRLNNPFYRGKFLWKGELFEGKHEIFIPKEHLLKVDSMSGKWGFTKRDFSTQYTAIVDGWLMCSCGCRVIYDPKTKKIKSSGETKTYHYYHCTNGKNVHEKFENIQAEKIWEQFGGLMEKISISEEFAIDIADALNKTEKKAHRVVELQIAEFNDKLKELDSRKDSLVDLMLSQQIEKELFDQQLKRINSNRDSLVEQLEAHQKSLTSALIETAKTVLELATSAKSLWISKSAQERREFLDLILSNPILDGLTNCAI